MAPRKPETIESLFMQKVLTPKMPHDEAPRTVPGLAAASAEDGSTDALNWWQATNVHRLCSFIANEKSEKSEGLVLCDAPGLGKTLSVLASCVAMQSKAQGNEKLVMIFAGKGIVVQWSEQVRRHFPSLQIFCAEKEVHKYEGASAFTEREASRGGVYVDERPSGRLPDLDVLRTFDMLILAKEMLSQSEDQNLGRVKQLQPNTRLVVVDESHNLNKKSVTKQEHAVRGFDGVPRLLLSGTPGTTAAEVYRMLRIIGHKSLLLPKDTQKVTQAEKAQQRRDEVAKQNEKQKGPNNPYAISYHAVQANHEIFITEQMWRSQLFEDKSEVILEGKADTLVKLLRSVFLHTPASAAPSIAPISIERVTPKPLEVDSYNLVLSLHQRDVLRSGRSGGQPDEWHRTRPNNDWYREKKKRDEHEPTPPSAEKTIGDLMRAANGGERFSLTCHDDDAPKGIKQACEALKKGSGDMPACASCGVSVAGLLQLPCRCAGEVCGECFQRCGSDTFELKKTQGKGVKKCPLGCRKKQIKRVDWAPDQPRLVLQTDAARRIAEEQKRSEKIQKEQTEKAKKNQQDSNVEQRPLPKAKKPPNVNALRKQPLPRPLTDPPTRRVLSSMSDRQIEKIAKETSGAGGKLVYLAEQLRDLAKQGDAKVFLTPPMNVGVRTRFVQALIDLIGAHSVADLNVKNCDQGMQLAKFKRGYGRFWQCAQCGEDYEDLKQRCEIGTCAVELDGAAEKDAALVRHLRDVEKIPDPKDKSTDPNPNAIDPNTIYIGNRVIVFQPGTRIEAGRGKVTALGRCNGKQPTTLRAAPAGSCFVLVLNPQRMEGLDLPDATHLYQVEPILRKDKEEQAQARGQRIGGKRKLEIVQLLVGGTIEEQQWNDLREIRSVAEGKKRTQAVEFEGKQVKLLNALRLLRPDPVAEAEDEAEDSEDEMEVEVDVVEEVDAEAEEEVEPENEEESALDDAAPTSGERFGDGSQSSGSGASSGTQTVSEHERAAARAAARVLLDAEDGVSYEHVEHAFAMGLRSWRGKVRKASTLVGVSILMIELRNGMLDDLFDADWKKGGHSYNRWIQSARSTDLSPAALEGLVNELLDSYDADAVVSVIPAQRESPAAPEQEAAGSKRRRTTTVDLNPNTVKTEQPMPHPAQPVSHKPAWKKLAVQLLKNGKISSAQVANAIKDMAAKSGETVDVYSLYEDELGLEAARVNDLVVAMES